jgi:hypothetical protein
LVYGLFLLYGVEGMPEAPFIPKDRTEIHRLPSNYGSAFGQVLERNVKKYLHNSYTSVSVEDFLSEFNVRLLKPDLESKLKGLSLADAERLIGAYVRNAAIDYVKYESHRKVDEASEVMESSGDWSQLDRVIADDEIAKVMSDLERAGARISSPVAKDLPLFFQLLLEGYTTADIVAGQLLPSLKDHPISESGLSLYKKTIEEVVRKHLGG